MNLGKRFIFINFKLLSNIDELDDDDVIVVVVVIVILVEQLLLLLLVLGTAAAFIIVVFDDEEEDDNVPIGLLMEVASIIPRPQVMLLPLLAEDRVRFERGSLLLQ